MGGKNLKRGRQSASPQPQKRAKKGQQQPEEQKVQQTGTQSFGDTIKISSWNVNGIRACANKSNLVEYANDNIDILLFNETKLQDSNVNQFRALFSQFPHQHWPCSQTKKGYSGVALLSKVEPISVQIGIGQSKHDDEGRCVTAEFDTFYVVGTYIPNAGQKLERLKYRTQEWDTAFLEHLRGLERNGKPFIWLGDLNVISQEIDIYRLKGNEKHAGCTPEERANFNNFLQEGHIDTFRQLYPDRQQFSWFSQINKSAREQNRGWRLDYIVVSQNLMPRVQDSIIRDDIMGSDHHPVELILSNQEFD